MSKIAVYTFSETCDNYGQVLQFFATQEYLKERGHSVSLIRFRQRPTFLSIIKSLLKRFFPISNKKLSGDDAIFAEWKYWSKKYEKEHPRHFEDFRRKNFFISEYFNDTHNIEGFDVFVTGSDQIWGGVNPKAFLTYASQNAKKISIATSIGGYNFSKDQIIQISEYLKDYRFVTTREPDGVELCRKAGYKNAQCILDPTFLIDSKIYLKLANVNKQRGSYLFLYLVGGSIGFDIDDIFQYALNRGIQIKYVASQGRHDDKEKEWATVPDWLSLIANAQYVITNSFHGAAMSIIFQKQFVVLPIIGTLSRMNSRIERIMKLFSLEDRIVRDSNLEVLFTTIDFSKSVEMIKKNKNQLDLLMTNNGI